VLSYEDRLLRACEDLCVEKERYLGTLDTLQFWRSRAHELEDKLKKLERGTEEPVQEGGANGGVGKYLQYDVGNVRAESVSVQHFDEGKNTGQRPREESVLLEEMHCSSGSCGGVVSDKGDNGCIVEDDLDIDCKDGDNSPQRLVLSEPDQ